MAVFEQMLDAVVSRRRAEDMGQYSLFGTDEPSVQSGAVEIPEMEWDQRTKLAFEKEMLGLYVSDHPLLSVGATLSSLVTTSIPGLYDQPDKELPGRNN